MNRSSPTIGLIAWIGLCFGAALVGSIFTTPAIPTWYATLNKPHWTPPAWLFGPVWSILYLMMGVAAWAVWRRRGIASVALPITLFIIQLALNAMWSVLFFGFQMPGVAFIEIVVLWVAILLTVVTFWRSTRAAGYLLLPYLFWVVFAGALNFTIWQMNGGGLGQG